MLLSCGGVCKQYRPFKKQEPLPHKFEWIEMDIAKNREEYGLIKTDLSKQKIEDKKILKHSLSPIKYRTLASETVLWMVMQITAGCYILFISNS